MRSVLPQWVFCSFLYMTVVFEASVGNLIELGTMFSVYNLVGGILFRVILVYYFGIYLKWELYGMFFGKNIEFGVRVTIEMILIIFKDYGGFEGVNDK